MIYVEIRVGKKIIIDPSRGGEDIGSNKNGLIEKDFNLELSNNVCYKNYELDAMYKYTCPSGYILVETNCEK